MRKAANSDIKYICVCGASASGIGKGVIVSSLAALMKAAGHYVTVIKIDPYLNIDAGTMSPYEHGEVFVLQDGAEADLDLGNYERFVNVNLTGMHNITTGKVYKKVLDAERKGQYLGKTVQIVPHVTNAIQDWILTTSLIPTTDDFKRPDICLIELGGTVGDIESSVFLEALRQMQNLIGPANMAICLVTFVPIFGLSGEPKTKPSQHGFKEMRLAGLSPDLVFTRSEKKLDDDIIAKLALFGGLPPEKVINVPDLDSVYRVPLLFSERKIVENLSERLQLVKRTPDMSFWTKYYQMEAKMKKELEVVDIAFVGKYVTFKDAYISVLKAFDSASIETGIKIKIHFIESEVFEDCADTETEEGKEKHKVENDKAWEILKKVKGLFVPGGFGFRGSRGKIKAIQYARENKIPFFGICYGFQLAVIEFCQNVLKWNAISEEYAEEYAKVQDLKKAIVYMPEVSKDNLGGTMRLGSQRVLIDDKDTWAYRIYGNNFTFERHRHRYEVNPEYTTLLPKHGLLFTGFDQSRTRMEMLEIKDHPYFFATQFHPELNARLSRPSGPFLAFVLACAGKLDRSASFEGGVPQTVFRNREASELEEEKVDQGGKESKKKNSMEENEVIRGEARARLERLESDRHGVQNGESQSKGESKTKKDLAMIEKILSK